MSARARTGSLPRIVGAAVIAAAAIVGILLLARWQCARRVPAAPEADSLAADRDRDGLPDPLPLRRLAERPGGDTIIEAIAAAGGWKAWAAHRAAAITMDGVFFDARGAVVGRRSERCTLLLRSPARIRIEAVDGSTVMGFGAAGAWGAQRGSDGDWKPDAGPGALPPATLRELTLGAWRSFGLPFNLGDADATVSAAAGPADPGGAGAAGGAPGGAPADSLAWVAITYPPAPGDTAVTTSRIGFDPETGCAVEVFHAGRAGAEIGRTRDAGSAPAEGSAEDVGGEPGSADNSAPAVEYFILKLGDYQDVDGVMRPLRRALFRADASGRPLWPVYEQRITRIDWDPPVNAGMFEPPEKP